MITVAVIFEGSLGLVAVVIAWLLGVPLRDHFRWDAVAWWAGVVATLPLLVGLLWIRRARWRPLARLNAVVDRLVGELFATASLLDLALISLLAGLGEELLFRGVLQTVLTRWIDPVPALVIAGVLFGLVHSITRTYAVVAAVVGIYLGWLFWHFDNLLAPIVTHALYDFIALAIITRGRRR